MKKSAQKYDGKLALDNGDVARVLGRIADLLEFKEENPFKLRSYRIASETVEELRDSLAEMFARGGATELQKIPGIGKSLSAQIGEILQTGTSEYFDLLKEEVPETVLDLRRVSGVGLKTSQLLFRDFGIKTLEELKAFAEGGGLASVSGLGEKTIARIKSSLDRIESERGMMRLNDAVELAGSIIERLSVNRSGRFDIVGQIRRGREMVDAIEILAVQPFDEADESLIKAFTSIPQIETVKAARPGKIEAQTAKGVTVILHAAGEAEHAVALVRTTGSIEHVRELEARAESQGYIFKGFRLAKSGDEPGRARKRPKEGAAVKVAAEEEFYKKLGLEFVPPEIREGKGEIEAASENRLPRLIERADIRGDFHMHTTWSDGRNSVREMIEAARATGYDYIAITDHTKSSSIANGNTPEELLEEIEEIKSVAREFKDIRVFAGAEVDILSDGSLDMPTEVLDRLDWIVCSIHSGFHQERQQITDRVIRAMETGYPNVFAHPTGRILGERAPYEIDLEQIIAAAKRCDVRLELNSSPYRLDLDSHWLAVAVESGVGIVISTDSHQTRGFQDLRYGMATARRAWLTPENVLNTLPLAALVDELERKKAARRLSP